MLQDLEGLGYIWERAKSQNSSKEPGALEDTD